MRQSVCQFPFFRQLRSYAILSHKIVFTHLQGVAPESHLIVPESDLTMSDHSKRQQSCRTNGRQQNGSAGPLLSPLCNAPARHEAEANEREICVAVGHGLIAQLNDSDIKKQ